MPSISHESLVSLFRESPGLGPELLRHSSGARIPVIAAPRLISAEFADLSPAEYRADAVVALDDAAGDLLELLIVQVQLDRDRDKHFAWPFYAAGARARFRTKATVLVVSIDEAIARWCTQPIELDSHGNTYSPVVIGPSAIPHVTDIEQARRFPELAVLSAAAHGHSSQGADIARVAITACADLDNPRSALYSDFVMASLGDVARRTLEKYMNIRNYQFQSDFAKKYAAMGRKEGHREVLLRLLALRFDEVPDEVRQRVEDAEMSQLEAWTDRVITADTLPDVFAED